MTGIIEAAKPKDYGPKVTQYKLDAYLKNKYWVTIAKERKEVDLSFEKFIVLSNDRPYCECCHTVLHSRRIQQHCAGTKHRKASDTMLCDLAKESDGRKVQARLEAGNLIGSTIDVETHEANLSLLRAFAAGNVPVAAVEHMKASNMVFTFVFVQQFCASSKL